MREPGSLMRSLSLKLSFLRQVFTQSTIDSFGAGKSVMEIGIYNHHVARLAYLLSRTPGYIVF